MFEWFDRTRHRRAAACGAVLAGAGLFLSVVPGVLAFDETVGLGLLFAARGPIPAPADVVVISISRDSAAAVGQSEDVDEWPRSLHAALIDSLSGAGVEAIAFDIIFDEPRADDAAFAAAVQRAGNVLLVERVDTEDVGSTGSGVRGVVDIRRPPVAELEAAALATAPFTLPRVPVRVSQFWTFGRAAGDVPSLPVLALQAYLLPHYDELAALLAESASRGARRDTEVAGRACRGRRPRRRDADDSKRVPARSRVWRPRCARPCARSRRVAVPTHCAYWSTSTVGRRAAI